MLVVHIRTDDNLMTDEVNEALGTKFKRLYWIAVTNDTYTEDSDDFNAYEDEIRERYGVDYLPLALKHHAHVDHCLTSKYPHDENYFSSFLNAKNCAKELIELLSASYNCKEDFVLDD